MKCFLFLTLILVSCATGAPSRDPHEEPEFLASRARPKTPVYRSKGSYDAKTPDASVVNVENLSTHDLENYACQLAYAKSIYEGQIEGEHRYATATGDRSQIHPHLSETVISIDKKIGEITVKLANQGIVGDLNRCPQFVAH